MKQPDKTEPTISDTDGKAPAGQEPDTAIQKTLEVLLLDVQAETGRQKVRFPFGDYEIWP